MELDVAIRTDRGLVRQRNEDSARVWPEAEGRGMRNAVLAAVADGMGGYPGGDRASALAVGVLSEAGWPAEGEARTWLEAAFQRAGERIVAAARDDPSVASMGTTMVAALFLPEGVWVASVGDSRLYWIRDGALMLVTHDHTMAEDLVRRGLLDAESADNHPSSHLLTRCLGPCPDSTPDLPRHPLRPRPGDIFLLTSDGLGRAVRSSRIPGLVGGKSAGEAAAALVEAALEGGAPDNVTVVVVRWLDEAQGSVGETFEFEFASEA